jgi:hypothetical protein
MFSSDVTYADSSPYNFLLAIVFDLYIATSGKKNEKYMAMRNNFRGFALSITPSWGTDHKLTLRYLNHSYTITRHTNPFKYRPSGKFNETG